MKKLFLPILLIISFLSTIPAQVNTVEYSLKGSVWTTLKNPVPNWQIQIAASDPSIPAATVNTDKNGNYFYSIKVPETPPTVFKLTTTDPCSRIPLVAETKSFQGVDLKDFIICDQTNPSNGCPVKFSYKINTIDYHVYFNATPDVAGAKYYWDFGDGQTAEGLNVDHVYSKEGTYTVLLTMATNICKSQYRENILLQSVVTKPNPYNVNAGCCGKMNIQSVALSTTSSPYSFRFTAGGDFKVIDANWDFGDGTIGTGTSTMHTYAAVGNYKVKVTIVGENCTVMVMTNVVVADRKNPPAPCPFDFVFSTDNLTAKFEAQFSQRPDKFIWDLGDGSSSTDAVLKHSYTKPGTYTIKLTAYYAGQPCTVSKTIKIDSNINPTTCPFDFTFSIANLDVKFEANFLQKPDSFRWDLGDGTNSIDQSFPHSYAKAGEYVVILEAIFGAQACRVSKTIKVGPRSSVPLISLLDVTPNPATDNITLSLKSDGDYKITIAIADITGVNLKKYEAVLAVGENKIPLDIHDLPAGSYIIYIYYNNTIVAKELITKK